MKISRRSTLLVALAAALLAGPSARAELVQFVTTGTFLESNSSVLQDVVTGLDIRFESGNGAVDLAPGDYSNVSFGQFNTSFTTATISQPVITGFVLNIIQVAPSVDPNLIFTGSITGSIRISSSMVSILFDGPLTLVSADGRVSYTILNADIGEAGQIEIGSPEANNGLTSINGRVSVSPIPEPSALALLGLGVPAVLLYRRRTAVA